MAELDQILGELLAETKHLRSWLSDLNTAVRTDHDALLKTQGRLEAVEKAIEKILKRRDEEAKKEAKEGAEQDNRKWDVWKIVIAAIIGAGVAGLIGWLTGG